MESDSTTTTEEEKIGREGGIARKRKMKTLTLWGRLWRGLPNNIRGQCFDCPGVKSDKGEGDFQLGGVPAKRWRISPRERTVPRRNLSY